MNKDHARRGLDARFKWGCADPGEIEQWGIGLQLVESQSLMDLPVSLMSRLPLRMRALFFVLATLAPQVLRGYRLNRFDIQSSGTGIHERHWPLRLSKASTSLDCHISWRLMYAAHIVGPCGKRVTP